MLNKFSSIAIGVICAMAFALQACSKNQAATAPSESAVSITQGGDNISFQPNAPQLAQFTLDTVRESALKIDLTAPAQNFVSVVKSEVGGIKLNLFESEDLTDIYSSYTTAIANVERASLALQRAKKLYTHGIAASRDLQDAETDYSTQQAALADNDAKLRAAGINPTKLKQAPVGTTWVIADVPEEQISSIKPGMRVDLEYVSYPGKMFTGRLSSIGQSIDPITRKFKVRIALSDPSGLLHPAMFCTAHFIGTTQRAITVPTTAIVREGDGTMSAWITSDGHSFTRKTVTIGLAEDSSYQITDGLQAGERIVSSGGIFLSNMNESQEPQG